jgi:DNA-directed RNA polymerase specialized sigma24 family protein
LNLPSGVTEDAFLAAVERVANVLAKKFSFGSHEPDDIQQMTAVFALEALPRFQPGKGSLEGFIYAHCSNQLSNRRRDETGARNDPPCRICHDAVCNAGPGHPDGQVCPEYTRWHE